MKFIDAHCDVLLKFCNPNDIQGNIYENPHMFDLKRMKETEEIAQFFAIYFMAPDSKRLASIQPITDQQYFDRLYEGYLTMIREYGSLIDRAVCYEDMEKNVRDGKVSAFLTIEDARLVDGRLEKLEELYGLGVRLVTLCGLVPNCMGVPAKPDNPEMMAGTLTDFGRQSVEWMMDKGVIVDVSHLSDGGFWDVADISRLKKVPFIASHSNARALTPSHRNLTDAMLRTVGESGGVIGINYAPEFLRRKPEDKVSRIADMLRHMHYIVNAAGIESVCLGSDFDGIHGSFEVPDISKVPLLLQAMREDGFTESEVEYIAYRNMERIIKTCMR